MSQAGTSKAGTSILCIKGIRLREAELKRTLSWEVVGSRMETQGVEEQGRDREETRLGIHRKGALLPFDSHAQEAEFQPSTA